MGKEPFYSIIMPSYNSEKTIGIALKSIFEQSLDASEIEVLVIDGGSTDRTRDIASMYPTIILNNPKRLPEHAKAIGIRHATGKYMIRMDTDEEFTDKEQLKKRKEFLLRHRKVKALVANKMMPVSGYGIASAYINFCGDPFSYFVYNTKKDRIRSFAKNVCYFKGNDVLFCFNANDIIPIADSGTTTLSLSYIKSEFPEEWDTAAFACMAFEKVVKKSMYCGCIKNDYVKHYSNGNFTVYLSKLRFRVINNLFYKEESGFSARASKNRRLLKRKFLFILYAMSVILPLCDSLKLVVYYHDISFLLHFFYLYYVCFCVLCFWIMHIFGESFSNVSYGNESTSIIK